MRVFDEQGTVTVEYCQFLFGTPAGQSELLSTHEFDSTDVISVGRAGIRFVELYADYATSVRLEVHDSAPEDDLNGEFTHTGTIEADNEPMMLTGLMGETALEYQLTPGTWNFAVSVTGREAAAAIVKESIAADLEDDEIVDRITAVEQWNIRLWPTD